VRTLRLRHIGEAGRGYRQHVGTIDYGGSNAPLPVDDRVLAHLKVVMVTKLRRNESFTLTWCPSDDEGPGRTTIWVNPSIPLRFVFDSAEPAELSRELITDLANAANSSGGITVESARRQQQLAQRLVGAEG
jgi:hypothetical protein